MHPTLPAHQDWFTPKEAAGHLGCSKQTIYEMIEDGSLLAHQLNTHHRKTRRRHIYRIPRNALELRLLETATYTPQDLAPRLGNLLQKLPRSLRQPLQQQLQSVP